VKIFAAAASSNMTHSKTVIEGFYPPWAGQRGNLNYPHYKPVRSPDFS
jgi:hypothetical protein